MISNIDEQMELYKNVGMKQRLSQEMKDGIKGMDYKQNQRTNAGKRIAALNTAVILTMVLLTPLTVFATINYYQQRMNSMTQTEKEQMVDSLQSSSANADSFSRELSENEKKRMEELRITYLSDGLFPEEEIEVVNDDKMLDGNKLVFCNNESMFILPDQELTDEEILQIIDFLYKRDYSLQEANVNISKKAVEMNQEEKERAVLQSVMLISEIYEVQIDESAIVVEGDVNNVLRIEMQDNKQATYRTLYDLDEDKVKEIGYSVNDNVQVKEVPVDDELFVANGKEIIDILGTITKEGDISDLYCDYNFYENNVLYRGIVSYVAVMKDSSCCVIKYDYNHNTVTDILLIPYEQYQNTVKQNEDKRTERGIYRNRVAIE